MSMNKLTGKVAVVTGASKGIGASMFKSVVEHPQRSGCNPGARIIIEKSFGRDLDPRCDAGRRDSHAEHKGTHVLVE